MTTMRKTIGIIGGMGPAATVDLMQRIVLATPAKDDGDHLRVIVDNNPHIPSRIAALIDKTGEDPAPMMIETAQGLEKHGAEILAMPCNTAHYYYDEIASAVNVPVLNLIDLAVKRIRDSNPQAKTVGLLASTALQITGLYEPYAARYGLTIVYPNASEQQQVMDLIRAIKSNQHQPKQLDDYYHIANGLAVTGTDCLLVACTELSVIGFEKNLALPHFDALDILVEEIIRTGLST